MIDTKNLELEEARKVAEATLEAVFKAKGRPISVAVVDPSGELIYFARMDGASRNSIRVAQNKAYTAVRWGRDTKDVYDGLKKWDFDIAYFGDPRYAPIGGGVLIKSSDGSIAGAVGVSGRLKEEKPEDEELARLGASALNIV
jgi:glc operon protein GlcG